MLENSVILSGSFNPLHEGHIEMLEKARGDDLDKSKKMVFELAIRNADKGMLSEEVILARMKQFEERQLNLLVTKEPYFYQKALLLPRQVFCIGQDTFVRLLDKKYYLSHDGGVGAMLAALMTNGTEFVVAGRVNKEGVFESPDMSIVPEEYKAMFTALKDFRNDISSTQLRA